jgi:thiol-disulfide isomerase/thioredoxin
MTNRRNWLIGAGAAAAAAGAGVAWRQTRLDVASQPEPVSGFWAMRWDTPAGGVIRMDSFRGKPVVLNFWATWCPPCIDELPLINGFFQKNVSNGWQVLGLAVDKPSAVQAFLLRTPLSFPIAMAGLSGTELSRSLGNVAGSLPFTLVIASNGSIAYRKMGRVSNDDLTGWLGVK